MKDKGDRNLSVNPTAFCRHMRRFLFCHYSNTWYCCWSYQYL